MTSIAVTPVKYIFLDVVAFSKRTVEAQCSVFSTLNRIVKASIKIHQISDDELIVIPSGDGMCIALLNIPTYDVHIKIAEDILRRIYNNNLKLKTEWGKFQVRVGVNQGDDNQVIDYNGMKNVIGAAINNTRRIMDLADGNQLLVSNIVYESLHPRKLYHNVFGQEHKYTVKHNLELEFRQLIKPNQKWLNTDTPSIFASKTETIPKLTKLAGYYFAHSIKNAEFIIENRDLGQSEYAISVLLWYLAVDSLGESEATKIRPYDMQMPETETNTLSEQLKVFMEFPFSQCFDLCEYAHSNIGRKNDIYFEDKGEMNIVNEAGKEKLKTDWPGIITELLPDYN